MSEASELAENKLIILYLLYKMDLPMTTAQILEFAVGADYMDYFSLQQYLVELTEGHLLDKFKDNNNTCYALTDNGERILSYFIKHIKEETKDYINKYVISNKRNVKREFEVVANWFFNGENDYMVKCGVSEDDMTLMEFQVSVVSKEHAKLICSNWKSNVNSLYADILNLLVTRIEERKTDN